VATADCNLTVFWRFINFSFLHFATVDLGVVFPGNSDSCVFCFFSLTFLIGGFDVSLPSGLGRLNVIFTVLLLVTVWDPEATATLAEVSPFDTVVIYLGAHIISFFGGACDTLCF
jgi:hypothetical protein